MTFVCATKHNQLAKRIHKALDEGGEERKPRKFFRVSETTSCGRKLAYGISGVKPTNKFPPQVLLKMQLGDVLHNWIRDEIIPSYADTQVTNWDVFKDKEEFLYHEYDVGGVTVALGGHLDGILRTSGREHPPALAVLEVKTAGRFSYMGTCKSGCMDPKHWSHGYARQANRYVDLWNRKYPKDKVNKFCIFLFNTDASNDNVTQVPLRDYWFKFNQDELDFDLQLRARVVEEGGNQFDPKLVTKGFSDPSCFECKGCLHRDECWR